MAEAAVLIRPDTTKFRALLEAELVAATKGVVIPIPVTAIAGSTAAASAATKKIAINSTEAAAAANGLSAATTRVTETSVAAAEAMQVEGAAAVVNAGELAASTRAHEQLTRGAAASVLSLGGVRGATLAASGAFLAGAAAITILAKSVKEAAAEQEALSRVVKILGPDLGKQSEEWAKLEVAQGLSTTEALKFQGALAQVLSVSGFTTEKIAQLSEKLVQLGADIAARAHLSSDLGLRALQLGISGNLRGLRQFGITLTAAEVKTEALRLSGKKLAADLTRQELVQARINLITKDAANSQGAAAERAGEFSQQSRILSANLANLGAEIGNTVTPVLTDLAKEINFVFLGLNKLGPSIGRVKSVFGDLPGPIKTATHLYGEFIKTVALGPVVGPIRLLRNALDDSSNSAGRASSAFSVFAQVLALVKGAADDLGVALARPLSLAQQLLKAQIAGNIGQQLSILAQQQKSFAGQAGRAFPGTKDLTTALQNQLNAQNQEKAIRAQIAADAKAAADAAAAAAAKAKAAAEAARAAHDQAIQDEIQRRDDIHQLAQVHAEGTKGLLDDIRAQVNFRRATLKEIAGLAQQIIDEKLRGQVLRALRIQVAQTTNDIANLRAERRKNIQEAKKAAQERRNQKRDEILAAQQFQVDLAEVQGRTNDEIRALEKLIRLEKRRADQLDRGSQARRDLLLKIARDTKELKDLKKAQQAKGAAFKELAFEFLQQQQGFAANLLGNLFPASAAAGTVGGRNGPGGAGGLPITDFTGGREDPTRGLGAAAGLAQAKDRGPTQGQQQIVIDLLRQMVRILHRQSGDRMQPEAHRQRAVSGTAFDTYGV